METPTPTGFPANTAIEPLLSIEKASDLIGISAWTVRHHLRTGKIGSIRIGRRILIEPAEIRRIVKEGQNGSMREAAVAV